MNRIALALVLSLLGGCYGGCAHKKPEEDIEPAPAAPNAPEVPAVKAITAEAIGSAFDRCWELWNQAKWDDLKSCYAPDATLESPGTGEPASKGPDAIVAGTKELKDGFPDMTAQTQLLLVRGHDVAAITLLAGTHTGPFAGATAMNQKVGFLMGTLSTANDEGRDTKEVGYFDAATMMGQLAPDKAHPVRAAQATLATPKEMVVAKDDAAEQANVALVKQLVEVVGKHEAKAFGELLANDVVWSDQAEAKDWTKAEVLADHQQGWRAFSDIKVTPSTIWGAGAYVVMAATLDGTNDGAMPEVGLKTPTHKKVSQPFLAFYKIDGGKVTRAWVFQQSLSFEAQLGFGPAPKAAAPKAPAPKAPANAGSAAAGSAAAGSAMK